MATSTLERRPNEVKAADKRTRELREAVERVYRKYGSNLTAFYRDAHRDAQKDSVKRRYGSAQAS